VLVTGLAVKIDMESWSFEQIFDNKRTGESIISSKKFSISQFVNDDMQFNDIMELLDALNIKKADLMDWSRRCIRITRIATKHPDRVNNLILHALSCNVQGS
jgi:pimeloyl-ACP methyl ester carboxylesterase